MQQEDFPTMSEQQSVIELSAEQQILNRIRIRKALNRRNFLAGLGAAGVTVAGAGVIAGCGSKSVAMAAGPSETDVLNFALNLEYLEATFYSYVVTGGDIPSSSTGGGPAPTGAPGGKPSFQSQEIADVFAEIYFDELSHVNDLRGVLGSAAVARPQLALNALGTVSTSNYITFARLFEDVGVTAYAGAATDLTGTNLQYAAQILAVEAFHSGAIRLIDIQQGVPYIPDAVVPADGLDVPPYDPGICCHGRSWSHSKRRILCHRGRQWSGQDAAGICLHAHDLAGAGDCLRQHGNGHRQRRFLPQWNERKYHNSLVPVFLQAMRLLAAADFCGPAPHRMTSFK